MTRLLIILLFPVFLFGQESDSLRLEKYIKDFLAINKFNGTILVIRDNKTIIQKSLGLADVEKNIPNSADTKFRIASCSKQFTGIAILQLQEQGKLSVNDKLSKYVQGVSNGDNITIDMLLTHRSGIHDPWNGDSFEKNNKPSMTKKKLLEIIKKYPSDFPPGTKFHYNNSGYFLLALIIEKVSNQTYAHYIDNTVLRKAKMYSSGADHNDTILPDKAIGYTYKNNKLIPSLYDNMECSIGCGSLYSTANDINVYFLALKDTFLFNAKSLHKFLTPPFKNAPASVMQAGGSYGYGIIADSLNKHSFITHGGGNYGFHSDITMYLDDKVLFVVFSNSESNVWSLSKGLQATLFNLPVIYPYKYKEIKPDKKLFEKFAGQYGVVKIYLKGGKLYYNDASTEEGEIKLIPETETRFFFEAENDRQVEFKLDKDQKVINAWVLWGGVKYKLL